jgi:predicted ATPase
VIMPDLNQIELPDTLQGVIMARIDQLDPKSKRVLQVASVIGRYFPYQVLSRVIDKVQ